VLAALFFVGPLLAAFKFSLLQSNGKLRVRQLRADHQNSAIRSR
jgi:hypothetical protein